MNANLHHMTSEDLQQNARVTYAIFWVLFVPRSVPIYFHCIVKASMNSLQNIYFCVLQKKVICICHNMNKSLHNFSLPGEFSLKVTHDKMNHN